MSDGNHYNQDQEAFGTVLLAVQTRVDGGTLPAEDLERLLRTIEQRASTFAECPGAVPNRAQIVGCFALVARVIKGQYGGRFVLGKVAYVSDGVKLKVEKLDVI